MSGCSVPANSLPGAVTVVGITDAGASSLPPEALAAVQGAEVLCGGRRHLAFFPDHPGERLVIQRNPSELVARLLNEERATVVLASGDPGCHGIGQLLADGLGR